MTETKKEDRAYDQAAAQLSSVIEMVTRLRHARECKNESEDCIAGFGQYDPYDQSTADEYHDEDKAQNAILEDALSIDVRSAWTSPDKMEPCEYQIILCTGGPAVRITGELDDYGKPHTANIEYQDWFTPWNRYHDGKDETEEYLMEYAQQFYFGE